MKKESFDSYLSNFVNLNNSNLKYNSDTLSNTHLGITFKGILYLCF